MTVWQSHDNESSLSSYFWQCSGGEDWRWSVNNTTGSTQTLKNCKIKLRNVDTGGVTNQVIQAFVWDNSSPSNILYSSTNTVTGSDLTDTFADFTFSFADVDIGVNDKIGFAATDALAAGTSYIASNRSSTNTDSNSNYNGWNGSSSTPPISQTWSSPSYTMSYSFSDSGSPTPGTGGAVLPPPIARIDI